MKGSLVDCARGIYTIIKEKKCFRRRRSMVHIIVIFKIELPPLLYHQAIGLFLSPPLLLIVPPPKIIFKF